MVLPLLAVGAVAAIGLLARAIVQMVITLGAIWLADRFLFPLVENAIAKTMQAFGVDESTAQDIVANDVVAFAEQVGVGAVALRSRLPLKIADRLGFTAKGFGKRKLPDKVQKEVSAAKGQLPATATLTDEATQTAIRGIATTKSQQYQVVFSASQKIVGALGGLVGVGLLITNTIDFGAWDSSAYQQTFQRFLGFFGLEPDRATTAPRTVSKEVFDKVYTALQNEGVTTIKNPQTGETLPYTRENAVLVIDKLASAIFIESGSVSAKQLLAATLAVVNLGRVSAPASTTPQKTASSSSAAVSVPRVFAGIVSQGALGNATDFQARPDDLIVSVGDLQTAAANNLAPFYASLLGRFIYEIKIQSSVTTRDGFTQRGTTQRVQTGTYANGAPKYKTVTNKFAVMNLYLLTDRGSRTKITSIVLGPTDAVSFQPSTSDVQAIESFLRAELGATNISQMSNVSPAPIGQNAVSGGSTEVSQDSTAQIALQRIQITPRDYYRYNDPFFDTIFYVENGVIYQSPPLDEWPSDAATMSAGNYGKQVAAGIENLKRSGVDVYTFRTEQFPYEINGQRAKVVNIRSFPEFFGQRGATPVVEPVPVLPPAAQAAQTLFEFYSARGESLPSIADRARLYESLSLGSAAYYTGTAEQNAKLLAALKSQ